MNTSVFSKPEMIWFIIGLVLFLLELVVPGFVIIFFGVGAWVTALVCLVTPLENVNIQILIFAVASIISLFALRKLIQKKFFYGRNNAHEAVEDEFSGREALSSVDFDAEGKGKVEFKGTTWKAESESEIKTGQTVIIIKKENFKLIVEPKTNKK